MREVRTDMDYRSLDRLLGALGEEMAARLPATVEPATVQPALRADGELASQRLRAATLAVSPLLVLAFLFQQNVIALLPFYAVFLFVMNARAALRTAMGWAVGWGTLALLLQALLQTPQVDGLALLATAGPTSVLAGLAGFVTAGLFAGALQLVHRGRVAADFSPLQMGAWGAGAGAAVAGALTVAALVFGASIETWFVPTAIVGFGAMGALSGAGSTALTRLTEEGRLWPRQLSGPWAIALAWGVAYGTIGLIAGAPEWALVGAAAGGGFAVLVQLARSRGHFDELTTGGIAALAGMGAAVSVAAALPLVVVVALAQSLGVVLAAAAAMGAGAATATLLLAQKFGGQESIWEPDDHDLGLIEP